MLAKATGLGSIMLIAGAGPALAYIDPGTGSIILQGLIGGIAGGLFILRSYWAKLAALLPGARKAKSDDAAAERGDL